MCKHTGAIEACNEHPRVTRGRPVTELIRRRASAGSRGTVFRYQSVDGPWLLWVFLKKILIPPYIPSLSPPPLVRRKMGYTDRIVALLEPILDAHETFLPSFSLSSSRFLIKFEERNSKRLRLGNGITEKLVLYVYLSLSLDVFPLERRFSPSDFLLRVVEENDCWSRCSNFTTTLLRLDYPG